MRTLEELEHLTDEEVEREDSPEGRLELLTRSLEWRYGRKMDRSSPAAQEIWEYLRDRYSQDEGK